MTTILVHRNGGGTAPSDPITELRQPAKVEGSEPKVAILEPQTRFHNLYDSRVSRLTMDFVPTGGWLSVRGMKGDAICVDEIDKRLKDLWSVKFDAVFLDPSKVTRDESRGSYDQWDHWFQLWIKEPPGDPPSDHSPEC